MNCVLYLIIGLFVRRKLCDSVYMQKSSKSNHHSNSLARTATSDSPSTATSMLSSRSFDISAVVIAASMTNVFFGRLLAWEKSNLVKWRRSVINLGGPGLRPPLSIPQSSFLPFSVDSPGGLGRARSHAAKHFDAIYAVEVEQPYKIQIDV